MAASETPIACILNQELCDLSPSHTCARQHRVLFWQDCRRCLRDHGIQRLRRNTSFDPTAPRGDGLHPAQANTPCSRATAVAAADTSSCCFLAAGFRAVGHRRYRSGIVSCRCSCGSRGCSHQVTYLLLRTAREVTTCNHRPKAN